MNDDGGQPPDEKVFSSPEDRDAAERAAKLLLLTEDRIEALVKQHIADLSVSLQPAPAKGFFAKVGNLFSGLVTLFLSPSTATAASALGRLFGAGIAFFAAVSLFGYTMYSEVDFFLKTTQTPGAMDWWRCAPLVTSTVFALALLRAANILSIPMDVHQQIELERARAKLPKADREAPSPSDKSIELVTKVVEVLKPRA